MECDKLLTNAQKASCNLPPIFHHVPRGKTRRNSTGITDGKLACIYPDLASLSHPSLHLPDKLAAAAWPIAIAAGAITVGGGGVYKMARSWEAEEAKDAELIAGIEANFSAIDESGKELWRPRLPADEASLAKPLKDYNTELESIESAQAQLEAKLKKKIHQDTNPKRKN